MIWSIYCLVNKKDMIWSRVGQVDEVERDKALRMVREYGYETARAIPGIGPNRLVGDEQIEEAPVQLSLAI